MASLSYSYSDPFLKNLVNAAQEDKAIADIATYGTVFTDAQLETLVPLRTMIICCQESVKAADDIFSVKLKLYAKEFDTALAIARSKSPTGVTQSILSIALERN